ncbi:MAG: M14 family metallopeptidase [Xanthomonadales bacterium]|nr:M14 family metallopeptidase [Xanthomonadales bacterium]
MMRPILAFLVTLLVAPGAVAAANPLATVAEQSAFKRTGHYDEAIHLCAAFARKYPDAVRCIEFGKSPQGRPMQALVVSRSGALGADEAHARKLPVILMQGGIHAGEIDGKDAGFLVLREVLDGHVAKGALDKLVWIFVPVFNIDGHERFKAWNRPNQRGPEEMGWRTTAQNFNLNRDYVKADAPEMKAMLSLMNAWDPIALVDLHVTDGAKFEHDISINIEPLYSGDVELREAGLALRTSVVAMLARQGSMPLAFYPSFVTDDDPASGFADGVPPPRFSHGYMPLRNRFGILVETHSWKNYATRVRATRNTIIDLLELTAERGGEWQQLAAAADRRAAQLGGSDVPLNYKASEKSHLIDFHGYAYMRTPSEISGTLMTRYDESKPMIWKIPLRDDVQPDRLISAPRGGYVVPAEHADWVGSKLSQHDIAFHVLEQATPKAALESFRASKASFGAQSFEGHQTLNVEGSWKPETRDITAGSLFVPIDQPKARLVVALLEPQAPDSLAAWGEFNNAFETKEYMESYVAEEIARQMIKDDPAVAAEFNARLASDPAFAKDPFARLAFFAQRHGSWDDRYNLYPVLRSATAF